VALAERFVWKAPPPSTEPRKISAAQHLGWGAA